MSSHVETKKNNRRSQIVESLIPLISSVPFDQLHVSQLCSAANISIGSFYHYFNSKNDILIGLITLIDEYMVNEVFPLLTAESELENLLTFSRGWARHVEANGIERSRLISQIDPRHDDFSGQKRVTLAKLEELIARGQAKGEVTASRTAEELSLLFMLAMRGVTTDWSRCEGRYSVVEKMEQFISLFVAALRP